MTSFSDPECRGWGCSGAGGRGRCGGITCQTNRRPFLCGRRSRRLPPELLQDHSAIMGPSTTAPRGPVAMGYVSSVVVPSSLQDKRATPHEASVVETQSRNTPPQLTHLPHPACAPPPQHDLPRALGRRRTSPEKPRLQRPTIGLHPRPSSHHQLPDTESGFFFFFFWIPPLSCQPCVGDA